MTDMPFGKYEGRTLDELAEQEPAYLRWLMKQDWFEQRFPDLFEEIDAILDEMG